MTDHLDDVALDHTAERLRAALTSRTAAVHPTQESASLAVIEHRVTRTLRRRRRHRRVVAVLATAAAVAVVLALPTVLDDGGRRQLRTGPAGSTTTTAPPVTSTTAGTSDGLPLTEAIWPPPGHEQYADPLLAARSFMAEYLGDPDPGPRLSAFRPGPASAGEVDVYVVDEDGAVRGRVASTLLLRRAAASWVVIGARTPEIEVDSPRPFATVGTVVVVEGRGRGYEGNINIYLVDGGTPASRRIGEVNLTAGATELVPFRVKLTPRRAPTQAAGSLLLLEETGFAVVPVRFGATDDTSPLRFVGREYEGDPTVVAVGGEDLGAAVVTGYGVDPAYAVMYVGLGQDRFLWLVRQVAYREEPVWRVVDAIGIAIGPGEELALVDCSLAGRPDPRTVAVWRGGSPPSTGRVEAARAWWANVETETLMPLDAREVTCDLGDA